MQYCVNTCKETSFQRTLGIVVVSVGVVVAEGGAVVVTSCCLVPVLVVIKCSC